MLGVVAAAERFVDADQLEADQLEPALLQATEDGADEAALQAVGLDQDEAAFAHICSYSSDVAGIRTRCPGLAGDLVRGLRACLRWGRLGADGGFAQVQRFEALGREVAARLEPTPP